MIDVTVLISGRGSNLMALVDAQSRAHYRVRSVISSSPEAAGLTWARERGIATSVVASGEHDDRRSYDQALDAALEQLSPDLIVLAGFMRILTPEFVEGRLGRMINIHPSLLPEFPGLRTHERVLAAGHRQSGASVHFVTPELDAGPVIAQGRIAVEPGDSPDELAARVLRLEHRLLPYTTELIATGRIEWRKGTVLFDDQPLQEPIAFRP